MSFREKRAWVSFLILLVVGGAYFGDLTYDIITEGRDWFDNFNRGKFYFALHALIIFVAAEVILHLALFLMSPKEARTPKDERETLIELKAARAAYTVLVIECLIVAFHVTHHGYSFGFNFLAGNIIVAAIVIAQLVKFGVQIFYHRRGS
jgi:hypothetical protein